MFICILKINIGFYLNKNFSLLDSDFIELQFKFIYLYVNCCFRIQIQMLLHLERSFVMH